MTPLALLLLVRHGVGRYAPATVAAAAYALAGAVAGPIVSETVYTVGPLLVGVLIAVDSPALALAASAAATFVGTLAVARGPVMRGAAPHRTRGRTRGLGPLRVPGFAALLCCAAGLC